MATLQNTTVPDGGYYRVGTSTNNMYLSSGGSSLAHFSNGPYYNGTSWTNSGLFVQLNGNDFNIVRFTSPTTFGTGLSLVATGVNSTTANLLGLGAAAGTAATDGKFLVNAGGTGKPFLEVTNCSGDGTNNSTLYSTFKGWLAVKINSNVGATAVPTGTWYIRLWG